MSFGSDMDIDNLEKGNLNYLERRMLSFVRLAIKLVKDDAQGDDKEFRVSFLSKLLMEILKEKQGGIDTANEDFISVFEKAASEFKSRYQCSRISTKST